MLEPSESTLFAFESFYSELRLNERVEDVLSSLEKHYSNLNTLTESYKIYPQSHRKFLESKLSNVIPHCDENWTKFYNEIFELVREIEEEVDVIIANEKYNQFKKKIEQWRADVCVETSVLRDTVLVKKKNLELLQRIHPHTQEFCLRIMGAVEEMIESKRMFGKTIEESVEEAKKELIKISIRKFQIARLEKLKQICKKLKLEKNEQHSAKMVEYVAVSERFRLIQEIIQAKENERNHLLVELKILPNKSKIEIDDMTIKNEKLRFKLSKLEQKLVEIGKQTKTVISIVEHEKRQLLEERSKLQVILAKEKALLCQIVKHCKLHKMHINIPGMKICTD